MATKSKLLPCPFCGGRQPKLFVDESPDHDATRFESHYVRCTRIKCGAVGPIFLRFSAFPNDQPERAVAGWNTRSQT